MKRFLSFFRSKFALSHPNDSGLKLQSKQFHITRSVPEGLFTFYAGEKAFHAMQDLVGLSVEEMSEIPARVLTKCRELGFAHGDPAHFIFDGQEVEREPSWTAMKLIPSLEIEAGVGVSRVINVFLPVMRQEVKDMQNTLLVGAAMVGAIGQTARQAEYIAMGPAALKAKYKLTLSHEMVHVFATDEYQPIMGILGLDLLELLTDSINLMTFYADYKQVSDIVKCGAAEGIPYLVNLLKSENPGRNIGPEIIDLAHDRAKKIIRECRQKCDEAQEGRSVVPGLRRRLGGSEADRGTAARLNVK